MTCETLGALCGCPRCAREYGDDDEYQWCAACNRFEAVVGSRFCVGCAGTAGKVRTAKIVAGPK